MKKDNTQPYWQCHGENQPLTLHQVQVFLWAKGICIAGHDTHGKLINARAYTMDEKYDLERLEAIILNEPMLADAILVKKVWMAVSRNIVVPESLYDRAEIDNWFKHLYFLEHDEVLATATAEDLKVKVVFPKKEKVRNIFTQYFPQRSSKFLICPSALLKYTNNDHQYKAAIFFLEDTCSITLFESNQLVYNKIVYIDTAEDIITIIGNYWEQLRDISQTEIIVSGVVTDLEKWQSELKAYFPNTNVNQTFNTYTFLEELAQCE